jgi:hypothetical protein
LIAFALIALKAYRSGYLFELSLNYEQRKEQERLAFERTKPETDDERTLTLIIAPLSMHQTVFTSSKKKMTQTDENLNHPPHEFNSIYSQFLTWLY